MRGARIAARGQRRIRLPGDDGEDPGQHECMSPADHLAYGAVKRVGPDGLDRLDAIETVVVTTKSGRLIPLHGG